MSVLNSSDRRLLTRLPPFSPVAVRLLLVLADERVSFKEVSRLIAFDPVLAGEVLRMANSGLYGRGIRIGSLLEAMARLGTGKLSQIAVTAALWRGLPSRTAPFVRDWWRHSIAAALIAQQCSQDLPADLAYTAALLHGVGQLALFEDAPRITTGSIGRMLVGSTSWIVKTVYMAWITPRWRVLFWIPGACQRTCATPSQTITMRIPIRFLRSPCRPGVPRPNTWGLADADATSGSLRVSPNRWRHCSRTLRCSIR